MIVSLSGPAGSGKSLLASILVRHGFREVSFAAPLKRACQQIFGFTDHQLFGPSAARSEPHPTLRMPDGSPLTARAALQVVGTDIARALCPSVWIDAALRDIRDGEDVVVSDARYVNELDALRARGAFLIRRRGGAANDDPHPSEAEMRGVPDSAFDAVLDFDPSKERLAQTLAILLDGWRARTEVA